MKKAGLILLLTGVIFFSAFSQEKTLLTIGNQKISADEFERIYLKNNQETPTEQDLKDYLDLFINFKLKVLEAENLGYDTSKAFQDEYNKYLSQLAEPYFLDKELEEQMIKEAYDRSKKEIRVSYIMIHTEAYDTTEAYERAMKIYERLENGEDFEKVAVETSDAPTVKDDKGDAWFNKVFMMPYKLENFAYTHKIGEFSKPIYTNKAYFIIKITGERQAPQKVRVEHIYVRLPKNPSEKDSIKAMALLDSIKKDLDAGVPFEDVAERYSQDPYSAAKGGDLGWFGTGKMIRNFETAAYGIENIGDVVGPVRTAVGYHYIKLTDRKYLGSFDEEKENLKKQVEKSDRYELVKESIINKLKKEYDFKIVGDMDEFYTKLDSTIFSGKWHNTIWENDTRPLATFADQVLTYKDFADYLQETQRNLNKREMHYFIDGKFNDFVNEKIKEYEITQLPSKNQDFKYLLQEYHDGLLLFDITNDMVWDKAVKDTAGLRNYYNENRNKYYQKINAAIYSYADEKTKKKTLKLLKQKDKKELSDTMIVVAINKKSQNLTLEQSGVFKEGDNTAIDYVIDLMKNNKLNNDQKIVVDEKNKKIIYLKDNLPYVRGLVTADYQNVLEKQWISDLRKKYDYQVNQQVFDEIVKSLKSK